MRFQKKQTTLKQMIEAVVVRRYVAWTIHSVLTVSYTPLDGWKNLMC